MCPVIPPSPSLLSVLTASSSLLGWGVLAIGVVVTTTSVIALLRTMPPGLSRRKRILGACVLYTGIFGGLFLVVGVADPWDSALFSWYVQALTMLSAQNCPVSGLNAEYSRLSPIPNVLRAIGFVLAFGGISVVVIWRAIRHLIAQEDGSE